METTHCLLESSTLVCTANAPAWMKNMGPTKKSEARTAPAHAALKAWKSGWSYDP
jgi:hypothetical protein